MFVPADERHGHAIREAVFAVLLSRPPSSLAVQRYIDFGKISFPELPSFQPFEVGAPIVLGAQPSVSLSFSPGASFQVFKPDGTLSWRVLIMQNQIAVNCLEYDKWENVWPRAKDYIFRAFSALSEDDNFIQSSHLQYINAFHWNGSDTDIPDLSALLNKGSEHIPQSFWRARSREWHLHQGWYADAPLSLKGRRLSRQHLTSQTEQVKGLTVLVDLLDRYDTSEPVSSTEYFDRFSDEVFDNMRRDLRSALRDYLNANVCAAIGAVDLS